MRIPFELASLAGLSKEIVLLGVRDHLEIWDREQWDGWLNDKQPHYDQIAESAFAEPVPAKEPLTTEQVPRISQPK